MTRGAEKRRQFMSDAADKFGDARRRITQGNAEQRLRLGSFRRSCPHPPAKCRLACISLVDDTSADHHHDIDAIFTAINAVELNRYAVIV
jgi:hypothetical protein